MSGRTANSEVTPPRGVLGRQARAYVMGLLAPIERKSSWQLAGGGRGCGSGSDAAPVEQRPLEPSRGARRPARMRDGALGRRDGVLTVDEIGFPKKGDKSAGVQRQCRRAVVQGP
ncbi:transposase [Nonomuraea sp. NPDC004702]